MNKANPIHSSPARGGLTFGLLRAVWTLVIAFCFNSMYVYTDGSIENVHPIRRSVWTAFPWLLIHLPMSAGLLIGGHVSAYSTHEELESGHRWLWGGGLGVGMLCMWIIAQLFRSSDPPGKLLLSKVGPPRSPVVFEALTLVSSNFACYRVLLLRSFTFCSR
jgi:hypothetical protein